MGKHRGVWRMLELINKVLRFQMRQYVALYMGNILGGTWLKYV